MNRWLICAVCGILCAAPMLGAASDRLVLLAEDTPGVTRIKINVDEIPFSLERPGPSVIDFVTPYRFRSVNASQLISSGLARRVANARLVPDDEVTRLRMVLNCDCSFDFSVSSGVLSVRIKDPVAAEVLLPQDETDAANVANLNSTEAKLPNPQPAPATAPAPRVRPAMSPDAIDDVASKGAQGGDESSETEKRTGPSESGEGLDPTDEVVLARDHLMRQLSRAAEQGLIQFVSEEAAALAPEAENVTPRQTAVTEKPETEPEQPKSELARPAVGEAESPVAVEDPLVAAAPPNPVEIPLRARTAVDRDFRADRGETRADVAYCIDKKRLDVPTWAQPGGFLETTSSLRSDLLDEHDKPRPEIATKLVRHLVVNGFGAEANQMLTLYGDAVEDREILTDVARLVDLKAPRPDGLIAQTAPCHPEAALWRKIAGLPDGEPTVQFADDEDKKAAIDGQMLEVFARLPAITRRILGARLMDNLIAKGEFELAKQLDLILLRSQADYSEALALSRARLLGETGRLEEAEELYSQLSRSNRPEAHTALMLLLESRINRNAGGSQQLSDALGDAAFSARGTELELPLKVAEIRSRTLTDGASEALRTLQAAIERSGGASELLRDVGHAALEEMTPVDGDAVDYAKAVMALRPYVSEGPTGDLARRKVAEILTESGLPNLALSYLEPTISRADAATSLVTAQTLLALNDVEQALSVLDGQTDPKAVAMKVEALGRLGRHEEAHQLSANLAEDSEEVRSARALRAGDWTGAASAGDRPQRLLAAYMASQKELDGDDGSTEAETEFLTTPEVDRETTLDSVRSVVEASKSARSIIEKALEDG